MQEYFEKRHYENKEYCYQQAFQKNRYDEISTREYFSCVMHEMMENDQHPIRGSIQKAVVFSFLEQNDKAFKELENAFHRQHSELALWIKTPFFENIKSDPRYAELIRKLKLEKYVHLKKK